MAYLGFARPATVLVAIWLPVLAATSAGAVPFIDAFSGTVGVYAVTIDPGSSPFTPLQVLESNPDDSFPMASSFKPLILREVLADVDGGTLEWRQKIDIAPADHSLDGGRIPRRSRLKKLAKKMISRSHNTSTDVLFKLTGLGAPSAALAAWGLGGVRVVMPTREFWVALSGLAPGLFPSGDLPMAAAAYAASARADQVTIVEQLRGLGAAFSVDQIDAATQPFYDLTNHDQATTFAILDDVDNIASPRELVLAYHRLFFDSGLSADSDQKFRKLMRRGDRRVDRRSIDVPLSYWGGKGGDDLGMGSVAGYGLTRNGNHVLYAIMGSHMIDEDADWAILESVLTWIFDTLDAS